MLAACAGKNPGSIDAQIANILELCGATHIEVSIISGSKNKYVISASSAPDFEELGCVLNGLKPLNLRIGFLSSPANEQSEK